MEFEWAICQHPMVLLIKEDTKTLARRPPWGSKDHRDYCKKVIQNLDEIRQYKEVKLCFETSIPEMLAVFEEFPELKKEFLSLIEEGKISFVGGTYGQPHIHTCTSESNYKQFELGLKGYETIFGKKIELFAVQEPSHHEQIPQLLNAFGLDYATLPTFSYSLIFKDEYELIAFMQIAWMKITPERGMEQEQITRINYTKTQEFARWVGLDGSEVLLYLGDPMMWCKYEDIQNELKKDLYPSPPVRLYLTDLLDFNKEVVEEALQSARFVLADEAIKRRRKEYKIEEIPRVRLYSYYSYLEGSKCNISYLNNRKLEDLLLAVQGLQSYLYLTGIVDKKVYDLEEIWETILMTQHHDILYPSAPELQEWSAKTSADEIKKVEPELNNLKRLLLNNYTANNDSEGKGILIFNHTPNALHTLCRVYVEGEIDDSYCLEKSDGGKINFQISQENGKRYLYFIEKIEGFGPKILKFSKKEKIEETNKSEELKIRNRNYECNLNDLGEISNLIFNDFMFFNEPANKLGAKYNNGKDVEFKSRPEKFYHEEGDVFDYRRFEGTFGDSFFKKELRFLKDLPRIDFRLTLDFKKQQIGHTYLDENKLCLTWPLNDFKAVRHDIPFGVVCGKVSRPLYAINWINCESDDGQSFTVSTKGMVKFFVKDDKLYNLLAWGDEGGDFMRVAGRMSEDFIGGAYFDLRLDGQYVFEYSIYLHESHTKNSDLFRISESYRNEQITSYIDKLNCFPCDNLILKFNNKNTIATSIFLEGDSVRCRFFESDNKEDKLSFSTAKNIYITDTYRIDKTNIENIEPYKIAEIKLKK